MNSTIKDIVSAFGVVGWIEAGGALLVAVGCGGELWILLNRLTRHIEPLPKGASRLWKSLARADELLRPIVIRFKVKGRKLFETKEELLERFFVMLVAFGVGVEFVCLMFSLHEVASLNKIAGLANERAITNEVRLAGITRSNLVLATTVEDLRRANDELEWEIQPRRITIAQRAQILKDLGFFKTLTNKLWIDITYENGDFGSRVYARAICQVLTNCGCDVNVVGQLGMYNEAKAPIPFGIRFAIPGNELLPWEHALIASFVNADLVAKPANILINDRMTQQNVLKIFVGPKPPGTNDVLYQHGGSIAPPSRL